MKDDKTIGEETWKYRYERMLQANRRLAKIADERKRKIKSLEYDLDSMDELRKAISIERIEFNEKINRLEKEKRSTKEAIENCNLFMACLMCDDINETPSPADEQPRI